MNTEQERADFEAFESKHGLCVTKEGELYRSHVVAWMWKAWQARAALQSQDRDDAERYRWLCDKFGITKLPCAIERIIAGDVYVADGKAGIDEAIDHARRIEGEGMSVPTMQAWEVWQARANIDSLRFRDEPVRCAVCGTHEVSAAVTCQNSSCPVYVNALRAHEERK